MQEKELQKLEKSFSHQSSTSSNVFFSDDHNMLLKTKSYCYDGHTLPRRLRNPLGHSSSSSMEDHLMSHHGSYEFFGDKKMDVGSMASSTVRPSGSQRNTSRSLLSLFGNAGHASKPYELSSSIQTKTLSGKANSSVGSLLSFKESGHRSSSNLLESINSRFSSGGSKPSLSGRSGPVALESGPRSSQHYSTIHR